MKIKNKYYIKVFGCQMNQAEGVALASRYQKKGWLETKIVSEADEIVIHTCSVRESAENRVFGLVNNIANLKHKSNHIPKVILSGCMLRLPVGELKKKLPRVDQFTNINLLLSQPKVQVHYSNKVALVPISNGCNNYCSYCVVPFSRGRETSRPFNEIIGQVKELAKLGHTEITLLGQNVNSYGKDFDNSTKRAIIQNEQKYYYSSENIFCLLVQRLSQINNINKINFITSNPWDFDDDLVKMMSLPKIDRLLHLPVQSGSNRILKAMNRKYTQAQYLRLINRIKKIAPDVSFGTDIIVGFPGETKADFQQTLSLCRKVGFVKGYINKYSPRPGTVAYRLKDDVPHPEKIRRWRELDQLINHKK